MPSLQCLLQRRSFFLPSMPLLLKQVLKQESLLEIPHILSSLRFFLSAAPNEEQLFLDHLQLALFLSSPAGQEGFSCSIRQAILEAYNLKCTYQVFFLHLLWKDSLILSLIRIYQLELQAEGMFLPAQSDFVLQGQRKADQVQMSAYRL